MNKKIFNRVNLIQQMVDKVAAKVYLEIGVFNGYSFLNTKCDQKIAVDPSFQISLGKKLKYLFKNKTNLKNKYYEITSNDFFYKQNAILNDHQPNVIFIDGLTHLSKHLKIVTTA